MYFTPLTVIAGTNASGKSNLFDALNFLSTLVDSSSIESAFHSQRGELNELFTLYKDGQRATEMSFVIEMLVPSVVVDEWGGEHALKYPRLRYELVLQLRRDFNIERVHVTKERLTSINKNNDGWSNLILFNRTKWIPSVKTSRQTPFLDVNLQSELNPAVSKGVVYSDDSGSIRSFYKFINFNRILLSRFTSVDNAYLYAARKEITSWRFLQLLPSDLRHPSNKKDGSQLEDTGKNLAAALYRFKQQDEYNLVMISRLLSSFIPNYTKVDVKDDESNQQYLIELTDRQGQVFSSRLLSEGTLRILALCLMMIDNSYAGTACFEEPENGIHPFRIKYVVRLLKGLSSDFTDPDLPLRQVIVNTHSPILIREIEKEQSDLVSIQFSRMITRIVNVGENRTIVSATNIIPVRPEILKNLGEYTDAEKNISTMEINKYLSTRDDE